MMFYRIFVLLFCISGIIYGQSVYTGKDVEICNSKFQLAAGKNLSSKSPGEIITEVGKSFLGVDYEASALDKTAEEKLIIHLSGLDCYTFLENTLVLSRCIKEGKTTFEDYQKELINIRYRGGKLNGYTSRLHYFSDWIYDCAERGIIKDITKETGGVPYKKIINFMSTHPASYKQLKDDEAAVKIIAGFEKEISKRSYYYIPKEKLSKAEPKIKSGDLIAVTTGIEGLDISHVGIAVKEDDGRVHLMHAPSPGKKVQITEQPLADYLAANKKQTGVMILRSAGL